MRIIYNFCTKLYHPTKLIPESKWLHDYAPIYKKKPYTEAELQESERRLALSYTPTFIYSLYWVMLGQLNLLHVFGGLLFTVPFSNLIIQAQLLRSVYKRSN
jgi:hypothetical protein